MSLDRIKKLLQEANPLDIKKIFNRVNDVLYYGTDGELYFNYVRISEDEFEVIKSLFPEEDPEFEKYLSEDELMHTVLQSLGDYAVSLKDDRLVLRELNNVGENYNSELEQEEKYCYNCRYYSEGEHLCNNTRAFSINKDYPMLRDFDGQTVVAKDVNLDKIMIPYNFGCIHWGEK